MDGKKYYQYTGVDEYSRWAYGELYSEHSTYSSQDFLVKLVRHAPFLIKKVQTDNGTEWTKRLVSSDPDDRTLFEEELKTRNIEYQRIRIATTRHNGKVERQHRTDGERFYSKMRMYSLEDGNRQLHRYNRKSNKILKVCLGMKSPNEILKEYIEAKW